MSEQVIDFESTSLIADSTLDCASLTVRRKTHQQILSVEPSIHSPILILDTSSRECCGQHANANGIHHVDITHTITSLHSRMTARPSPGDLHSSLQISPALTLPLTLILALSIQLHHHYQQPSAPTFALMCAHQHTLKQRALPVCSSIPRFTMLNVGGCNYRRVRGAVATPALVPASHPTRNRSRAEMMQRPQWLGNR